MANPGRFAANDQSPEADDGSTNSHTDAALWLANSGMWERGELDLHAHGHACNEADEDGQNDAPSDHLGELSPSVVRAHVLMTVVPVVAGVVASVTHAMLPSASRAHVLEALEELASEGAALVLGCLVGRARLNGVDGSDHELACGGLDELDVDVGDAIDKVVANLDNLQIELDELELLVGVLLSQRFSAEAVAKLGSARGALETMLGSLLDEVGHLRCAQAGVP